MSILHNILLLSTYYDPKENLRNNARVDCTNGKRMVIIINDEKVMLCLNSNLIVYYNVSMIHRKLYSICISLCISILSTISFVIQQWYLVPKVFLHPVKIFRKTHYSLMAGKMRVKNEKRLYCYSNVNTIMLLRVKGPSHMTRS